jgi:hypothetical protein
LDSRKTELIDKYLVERFETTPQSTMAFSWWQIAPDQSWENVQLDHTCEQDCLIIMDASLPLLQFFLYLNLKLTSIHRRWSEMLIVPLSRGAHTTS